MITRRFSFRIFALLAAYALALQALLLNIAVICASAPGADQPSGQDHQPCAPDCLMAACGHGGLAPPDTARAAIIAPTELQILAFTPFEIRGRTIAKTPQIPRAPPLT